jgi:hypothetical protein
MNAEIEAQVIKAIDRALEASADGDYKLARELMRLVQSLMTQDHFAQPAQRAR